MKCGEVEEFVSAMYDGEAVPQHAAEHIAHCATCQELLKSFAEMGAELRTFGHSQSAEPMPAREWAKPTTTITRWWKEGWQTMRIPRVAFAALLLLLVVVGSRLTLLEVRAHEDGPVLLLKLSNGEGTTTCPMSTIDPAVQLCNGVMSIAGKNYAYVIRFQKKQGEMALLSLFSRAGQSSITPANDATSGMTETQLSITPGEATDITLDGGAKAKLTAQWSDHIPVDMNSDEPLDPSANEIRLFAPLLIKNGQVAGEMGGMATSTSAKAGAYVYIPKEGRFVLSLSQLEGSVAAKLDLNRVAFTSEGQNYLLVTGAPIARGETIWVKHEPSYKPDSEGAHGVIGAGDTDKL